MKLSTLHLKQDEAKQLNSLFEKIYSESNPDVRRAMNKSFVESGIAIMCLTHKCIFIITNGWIYSNIPNQIITFYLYVGGTVLSTNWQEVSSQTVDVKPPTGTEFRPWDE